MNFDDFSKAEQNFLNGKLSVFVDNYIRKNKVWTATQLTEDFITQIMGELIADFDYLRNFDDPRRPGFSPFVPMHWLPSNKGKEWIFARAEKKYSKDKDIALRESPIVERIRFGDKSENMFYDVNFGLKGTSGHNRVTTDTLRGIKYSPWTIEHMNFELSSKYSTNLEQILNMLPLSSFLVDFVDYWLKNFYSEARNPALIPLIKSFRSSFYYFLFQDKYYPNYQSLGDNLYDKGVQSYRYGFDFGLINFNKQKAILIDIKEYLSPELTLKNIVAERARNEGFHYVSVAPSHLKTDIKNVFSNINDYLSF